MAFPVWGLYSGKALLMSDTGSRPANHPLEEGEYLYVEGQPIRSLAILVQGRLGFFICPSNEGVASAAAAEGLHSAAAHPTASHAPERAYRLFELDRNVFIGAADLVTDGISGCTCLALGQGSILSYPLPDAAAFWQLLNTQKDYGTFVLQSLGLMLSQVRTAILALQERTERMRVLTENLAIRYWSLKALCHLSHRPSTPFFEEALDRFTLLQEAGAAPGPRPDPAFMRTDHGTSVLEPVPGDADAPVPDAVAYAIRLNSIPLEVRKSFFGADAHITERHIREAADGFNDLLSRCRSTLSQAESMLSRLYRPAGDCLYEVFSKAALEMATAGQNPEPAVDALEEVIAFLHHLAQLCSESYDHPIPVDLSYVDLMRDQLLVRLRGEDAADGRDTQAKALQALPDELKNSTTSLLAYAGIASAQADPFLMNLTAFRNLKDRQSDDPEVRDMRAGMMAPFRALYGTVLQKALADPAPPRSVLMFLRYGYADEWLLPPEQTLKLYRMAGIRMQDDAALPAVWHLPDWMRQIRARAVEPSRNTQDMDYQDVFRDKKRKGQLTDKDKPAYEADTDGKLAFELDIQLGTNQKNCHGKPGIFYPVLHTEMITRDPDLAMVTQARIHTAVADILSIDPTAFHREVHFQDPRHVIEKERILKAVAPDVILLPTFGSRAMMWQEISGRSRTTPGRFLLPVMTDENVDTLLLRLVGNFRWELCRTLMGTAWNDVTHPSLTSEYADYLQFYKSNKDLSDDAKERVRSQISKYRGNTRDIFTADYETWIRNESRGSLRLNKVVRKILFRYCPFGKKIRRQLERHPAYADLILSFESTQAREAKSLETRYMRYRAHAGGLPPDLEENLRLYREL